MSDYKMMSCNQCCHTGKDCDVCVSPGCGEPENLSIYSPIIYDEVGINLCRTITIPENILTLYPTTTYVQLLVADIKIYSGKGYFTGEEEYGFLAKNFNYGSIWGYFETLGRMNY